MKDMESPNVKKMMFIISSMAANGAERVMSLLVNNAVSQGNSVMLVLMSKNTVEYKINEQVQIVFCGAGNPANRIKNLRKQIIEFCPHVIVSFLTTCNIYSCIAAIGLKIPVVISERNDPIRDCASRTRRCIRNFAYKLASGYIFQTEDAAACFSKKIRNKSTVIPNPVKDNLPYADLENSKKEFVAAGRLTPQKNYPMMIKAFANFHISHPEYILRIFGNGELHEELQRMIDELGLSQCIFLEGAVKNLHERMVSMRGFILSSDYEGISNSLLEEMAMGLPCISTDCPCGGSRHLIQDGDTGILVTVGDSRGLSNAMSLIADDRSFASKLSNNATVIRATHSESTIVAKYFEYINRF
jgi:glycosyltransferase involved in cell wall biosynthesis